MNGIVYLHGKATPEYNGAEEDGFVLSSSEFGRAYLSDGWATTFIREIIERYVVVFIGYGADDPPVQYLLEALNKTNGSLDGVFALQSGEAEYATMRWRHKGVRAIAYDPANRHAALWSTLEKWAERATNPDAWVQSVVQMAKGGPENLEPYQRGQVAHLVGSVEGARALFDTTPPPPATWLAVLDPYRRYAAPEREKRFDEETPFIDPFDLYGLDSDVIPEKVDPEDDYAKRKVPPDAWDGFLLNKSDRMALLDENISSLRGYSSASVPRLPSRLDQVGTWIAKVSHQPAVLWWATRQGNLHPQLLRQIGFWLEKKGDDKLGEPLRSAWRFFLDSWQRQLRSSDDFFQLGDDIRLNGWNGTLVRQFSDIALPFIKVETASFDGPVAPIEIGDVEIGQLVSLDVEYPDVPADLNIPDSYVRPIVSNLGKNLETAVQLEKEIGGYGLGHLSPISPHNDGEDDGDRYGRTHGLSSWMLYHVKLMDRLLRLDPQAALREFESWNEEDETVFSRLRMWALAKKDLIGPKTFRMVVKSLSDNVFWDSFHARDLLLAVSARWPDLDRATRNEIERRILKGPSRRKKEGKKQFRERRAWTVLNRINWMKLNGLQLSTDMDARNVELQRDAPAWKLEYAAREARSLEGRVGTVRTVSDPTAIVDEPLANVLSKALELSKRRGVDFTEHDPFRGFVEQRPVRTLAVLRDAARRGDYPEWAWRTFLNAKARESDPARFSAVIAGEILKHQPAEIANFIRSAADWLQKSTKALAKSHSDLFYKVLERLISVVRELPAQSKSSIVRTSEQPDWTMESINSATGDLAEALFDVPQRDQIVHLQGLDKTWSRMAERLLSAPGEPRRHALVIFAHQLNWLYWADPRWTEQHLLSVLESIEFEDRQAFWAGFLWRGQAHGYKLFGILKPQMLELAKSGSLEKRGHSEALTGLILSGWRTRNPEIQQRLVSDSELRDVLVKSDDDFRVRVLWNMERSPPDQSEDQNSWIENLTELLENVWPRQIVVKSPKVTARLCDLAFSSEGNFVQVAQLVLPLLGKVGPSQVFLPALRRTGNNVTDSHPGLVLALLHAVLPDNAKLWPYGIDATLDRIGHADTTLNNDERLIELRRIWNSR
ncbi:putative conserved protein [Rhizobium favelukesii]|uniref:Conserved protein n=2 Tax=Rhizobium/Agrobacterium group TaxID=227290 RepID=W6RA02_9HYPH|nr:putative conserved protein [Rhizobium favelukesii]